MKTTVISHFNLDKTQSEVDFLNVNVTTDSSLFVDPFAVAMHASSGVPWATTAHRKLNSFFDRVLDCIADPDLHAEGERSLSTFAEPKETRLGMAEKGFSGSGTGPIIGQRMWRALLGSPLCAPGVEVLRLIEHIAIYVDDVSNDRISDLTTRITVEELIAFTHDQMAIHPGLNVGAEFHPVEVWDAPTALWIPRITTLPFAPNAEGVLKPLLLVPKKAVHLGLRLNPRGFWGMEALTAIQMDDCRPDKRGILRPTTTKETLKKRPDLRAIRPTNTSQTMRIFHRDGRSLVENYSAEIGRKYDPLSDSELERRIAEDA
ncbi:hypothetical protein [Cryobacterium sp. AP23]